MKNLLDHAARAETLKRLDALRHDSRPAWGRMDAGRVLCHLTEWFRMASGELPVRSKSKRAFQVFPLKHLILYVLPFPKGVPTAPELLARAPGAFDADKAALRSLIEGFGPSVGGVVHPLFGPLDASEWGTLAFRHTDHHFRQFGV